MLLNKDGNGYVEIEASDLRKVGIIRNSGILHINSSPGLMGEAGHEQVDVQSNSNTLSPEIVFMLACVLCLFSVACIIAWMGCVIAFVTYVVKNNNTTEGLPEDLQNQLSALKVCSIVLGPVGVVLFICVCMLYDR